MSLRAAGQPIDTGTAAGKAFLDMLDVFAEFETNLRKERQAEGIAVAKARGIYKGGKARIDPEPVRRLAGKGMRPTHIARQLGISRGTVYRFLPIPPIGEHIVAPADIDIDKVSDRAPPTMWD